MEDKNKVTEYSGFEKWTLKRDILNKIQAEIKAKVNMPGRKDRKKYFQQK